MNIGQHKVILRDATSLDKPWVCSTWIESTHQRHPSYTKRQLHALVNTLFVLTDVSVKVAEVKGAPDILIGFVASVDDELLWLYVSSDFRGHGVAKALKEAL